MTKVLVTGGAGFIGSHLSKALLDQGHSVRILDNFSTGRRSNLQVLEGEVEVVEGDIQSYERVNRAVTGCEFVFHQAALPSVPRSVQDPLTSNATNVVGTLNVLLASRDHAVIRVILASSSSVYGSSPRLPKREDDVTLPISPYAAAKLACENYARSFHQVYGLETVALRYFNVFGPRQDPSSAYAAVIPRFAMRLLAGEQPVIFGDGEQSRDFTAVANVVEANILSMDASAAPGGTYNIACGERISVNRLAREIGEIVGREVRPHYLAPRGGDVAHSVADLTLAERELGYRPVLRLREGLEQTILHIREREALVSPFDAASGAYV